MGQDKGKVTDTASGQGSSSSGGGRVEDCQTLDEMLKHMTQAHSTLYCGSNTTTGTTTKTTTGTTAGTATGDSTSGTSRPYMMKISSILNK